MITLKDTTCAAIAAIAAVCTVSATVWEVVASFWAIVPANVDSMQEFFHFSWKFSNFLTLLGKLADPMLKSINNSCQFEVPSALLIIKWSLPIFQWLVRQAKQSSFPF